MTLSGKIRTTNGHEWTTKGEEGGGELNHEIHEIHEKTRNDVGLGKSEPRMDTNGEEGRELNHEIHEMTLSGKIRTTKCLHFRGAG